MVNIDGVNILYLPVRSWQAVELQALPEDKTSLVIKSSKILGYKHLFPPIANIVLKRLAIAYAHTLLKFVLFELSYVGVTHVSCRYQLSKKFPVLLNFYQTSEFRVMACLDSSIFLNIIFHNS